MEPFPFDGKSVAVIETFELWLALVDARALKVDRRAGALRGTPVDIAILRLVSSKGGDDDLSCMIPLWVLAELRDAFDGLLKEVEERNH